MLVSTFQVDARVQRLVVIMLHRVSAVHTPFFLGAKDFRSSTEEICAWIGASDERNVL